MAGTIIADFIRADANKLSINVGNTVIASVNALGILSNTGNVMISSSGTFDANNVTAGTLGKARLPTGSVLQVVQTVKTDTFTMSGSTYTTVTGLTASITPTSANSKILVFLNMNVGSGYYTTNGRILRNGSPIAIGDANGGRYRTSFQLNTYVANQTYEEYHMLPVAVTFLDSPATTSAVTYTVQLANYSSYSTAVNRSIAWQDPYDSTTISTFTLMEIAQ